MLKSYQLYRGENISTQRKQNSSLSISVARILFWSLAIMVLILSTAELREPQRHTDGLAKIESSQTPDNIDF